MSTPQKKSQTSKNIPIVFFFTNHPPKNLFSNLFILWKSDFTKFQHFQPHLPHKKIKPPEQIV